MPAAVHPSTQPNSQTSLLPTSGDPVQYVSPTGDDAGVGSAEAPYRTLSHALAGLRPGDTLVVRGGTYQERVNLKLIAGSRNKPITVLAAAGERPVVRGLLWLKNPTWWRIVGINVTWDSHDTSQDHMVKLIDGHDWLVSDAEMWDARSYAALFVGGVPHRFELRNLYVHDTHRANGVNEDHLIYLNTGSGSGMVDGCLLVGSPNGRAIKLGTPDGKSGKVRNIVIAYNTMIDNLGPSNVQLAFDTSNTKIQHNIMVHSASGQPNITAFQLSGRGNIVLDNLGWESTGVVQHGLDGLVDDGGNVHKDPRLGRIKGSPYLPAGDLAARYGCSAAVLPPGETSWCTMLN